MSMFIGSLSVPFLLSEAICMGEDNVGKSELIGTLFVVSGIITLMQVLLGVRLVIYTHMSSIGDIIYVCKHFIYLLLLVSTSICNFCT